MERVIGLEVAVVRFVVVGKVLSVRSIGVLFAEEGRE